MLCPVCSVYYCCVSLLILFPVTFLFLALVLGSRVSCVRCLALICMCTVDFNATRFKHFITTVLFTAA